jgi:SAM-dependent methyltransferase
MSVTKNLAGPLRSYFNPRFEAVVGRIAGVDHRLDEVERTLLALDARTESLISKVDPEALTNRAVARLQQADALSRIDLREHNAEGGRPTFDNLQSQSCSAAQCDDPRYLRWAKLFENWQDDPAGRQYNRKIWEFAYIAESVERAGLLSAGHSAVGFGVGHEPLPALFARHGLDVLATDQGIGSGAEWAETGQLMGESLAALSRPNIVEDTTLAERVRMREVDMNAVPDDIGTFDVVWSSCVIEHLGSPERGMQFILDSCRLLRPGGIAVHTTELELTPQDRTMDYGHCAVYRVSDLRELARRLPDVGCQASFTYTVSMDRPEDRWVSLIHTDHRADLPDGPHLKLVIGDSVSTSFGIAARRMD